ncbi:MAG: Asp-tRNA(Asn)/Glu-tRNA(Gln) amidotransferase A subunit family amidase [Halieaceae bacterium]|jgi:Asp-tRNA(Asn)/Glu-tRNA(Gln) amidotransferase A subunit family amidase
MSNELCYISALDATSLFRSKQLSPVELMEAVIEQSECTESDLNAFSHTFFDSALEQAKAAEHRYRIGRPLGLLDGVPVAIKDEMDVAGQVNTEGSLLYQNRIAEEDATLVGRLRSEGAIFHARTTCPEFCSLWNTHSRLHGVTRNPWNLEITPGGSSGGSGASLAAGTSTLATGSDIGGSIRFPASQCGLVGFKPPYGRVPDTLMPFNMEPYCANGPMARTVADTALMQNIMSGSHLLDAASTLPKVNLPLQYGDSLKGTRIAYTIDFGRMEVEPAIAKNTLAAIARLASLGAEVREVKLNWPTGLERAYNDHMDPLFVAGMAKLLETDRDQLCDYNIHIVEEGIKRLQEPGGFYRASCIEVDMYAEFATTMTGFAAFVCPTVFTTGLRADFNPAHEIYHVNGKPQDWDLNISSCHLFNMMGRCPSMSIPSGFGENGVPTGLHIAATAYADETVFRVAAAFESASDWSTRPPGY